MELLNLNQHTYVTKKEFRANILVLVRLANAFFENGSMKKTQLHFASRIRWNSFECYLRWLIGNKYLESRLDEREEKYHLTERGREMFNMLLKFYEHVRSSKP